MQRYSCSAPLKLNCIRLRREFEGGGGGGTQYLSLALITLSSGCWSTLARLSFPPNCLLSGSLFTRDAEKTMHDMCGPWTDMKQMSQLVPTYTCGPSSVFQNTLHEHWHPSKLVSQLNKFWKKVNTNSCKLTGTLFLNAMHIKRVR